MIFRVKSIKKNVKTCLLSDDLPFLIFVPNSLKINPPPP